MNKTFDQIYKLDSKGKTRVWYMEQQGGKYRTFDGVLGGTVKSSEWRDAHPTNVGRSNARDSVAQATFEVEAAYEKKLTREYHRTLDTVDQGAHFYKPMLAEKYLDPKKPIAKVCFTPGYGQPKLDGIRCLAMASGLYSREGQPLPGVGHIFEALRWAFDANPELVLDGELYNHELKDDFNRLSGAVKRANPTDEELELALKLEYHVYDMPSHDGKFSERLAALVKLGTHVASGDGVTLNGCIVGVKTVFLSTVAEFDAFHGQAVADGYEGTMHREDELYAQKRTYALKKRKDFDTAEFDIARIDAGEGNWAGAAKRVWCWLPGADRSNGPDFKDETNIFGAGIRGSKLRGQKLLNEDHKVVTIRYFGFTPSAIPKPRFAVAIEFHGAARTL